MVLNLRDLLTKLKYRWAYFRHSVQLYFNYDCDRWLPLVMISSGMQPIAGPEPWKRNCLILYQLLGYYQLTVAVAKVGFGIADHDEFYELCSSLLLLTPIVRGLISVRILEFYNRDVRRTKEFLRSNMAHSGNRDFDASVRLDAAKFAGKVTLVIFIIQCCNQVVVMFPSSLRNLILSIPKQFQALGITAARLLQDTFLSTLVMFWGCRYFCASVTAIHLLMGLRSELKIVARAYGTIEDRMQAQVLDDPNNVAETSRKMTTDVFERRHFQQILRTTLEQHVEVLRNIQNVKPIVSFVYAIGYYATMIIASFLLFLVITGEASVMMLMMMLIFCVCIVECYFWAHLIESIEEIMETIAVSVAELAFGLEHSVENHSKYVQMRTSLLIIQVNASQSGRFSCGGIFPISIESCGDLCIIIYRLAMFLLKIQ